MFLSKPSRRLPAGHRLKSDAILLLVSAVWGSGFIAQRIAAETMGNFTFNGTRFILATFLLSVLIRFRIDISRANIGWTILAGSVLFCASTLQQVGIKTTTAGNAGFITSLYVVIIPILLVIFTRQRIRWTTWSAALLAVIGALLLSTGGRFRPAQGDWIELAGALMWAVHVIVVGKMARRMDNLQFAIGQFAVCGLLNIFIALAVEIPTFSSETAAWLAVLYSAVFPIGLGFTLQVIAQRHAPTTDAAIIFSMEAVFAAIFGYFLLDEKLVPLQIAGCVLIILAILLAQLHSKPLESAADTSTG
jgi:drug/metabolite transporter (DMT)-like permease